MKDELTVLREKLKAKEKEYYDLERKITYNYMVHYCKVFKDKDGNKVESRVYTKVKCISSIDIDDWVDRYCTSTSKVQYFELYYIKLSPKLEMLFEQYRNLYNIQLLSDPKNADPCIQEYLNSPEMSSLLKGLGFYANSIFLKAKEELKRFLEDKYNMTLDEKAVIDTL